MSFCITNYVIELLKFMKCLMSLLSEDYGSLLSAFSMQLTFWKYWSFCPFLCQAVLIIILIFLWSTLIFYLCIYLLISLHFEILMLCDVCNYQWKLFWTSLFPQRLQSICPLFSFPPWQSSPFNAIVWIVVLNIKNNCFVGVINVFWKICINTLF